VPTLARIWAGQITGWNDPAIAKLNPTSAAYFCASVFSQAFVADISSGGNGSYPLAYPSAVAVLYMSRNCPKMRDLLDYIAWTKVNDYAVALAQGASYVALDIAYRRTLIDTLGSITSAYHLGLRHRTRRPAAGLHRVGVRVHRQQPATQVLDPLTATRYMQSATEPDPSGDGASSGESTREGGGGSDEMKARVDALVSLRTSLTRHALKVRPRTNQPDLDRLLDQPLHRLVALVEHPAGYPQRQTWVETLEGEKDCGGKETLYLETMALSRSTPRQSCVRSLEPMEYPSKMARNSLARITLDGICLGRPDTPRACVSVCVTTP
jgi:hypothetical protein